MIDYLPFITDESEKFLTAITGIADGPESRPLDSVNVPACPDWNAADLAWHFAEVQYFWATMVGDGLSSYADAPQLVRPPDGELPDLVREQSAKLVRALRVGEADDSCWSWHPRGGTVGWARCRQAHEALIHRVDAEQAAALAGGPGVGPIDEELAADGIEEMLAYMANVDHPPMGADGNPTDSSFEPDGTSVRIQSPDRTWDLVFGYFGVADSDGVKQHEPAMQRSASVVASPSAVLIGQASEIDLWLWRRSPLAQSTVRGDGSAVDRLAAFTDLS